MKQEFLDLKIKKMKRETEDTISITFNKIGNEKLIFEAGQFLTLIINVGDNEIKRCYSISSTPSDLPDICIAIKEYQTGVISHSLIKILKEGDILKSLPPMGSFTLNKLNSESVHSFFYAAGSGIAPVLSLLKQHLIDDESNIVTLFYSSRDENNIIFNEQLNSLKVKYQNRLNIINVLSNPKATWNGEVGRLNDSKIISLLNKYSDNNWQKSDHYICGPEGMMNSVMESLLDNGVSSIRLHKEYFTQKILTDEIIPKKTDRTVSIVYKGKIQKIIVKGGDSILEAALENDINIPYSCMSGTCGSCKARLLSGTVNLERQRTLTQDEINKGITLTCVGYPVNDHILIDYDVEIRDDF